MAQFILGKKVAHPALGITIRIGDTNRGYGCNLYGGDFNNIKGKLEECFLNDRILKAE
ncbi:MAG TPA: hypothetical protein VD907_03345 [Verrucomicrobiae bacterium]|nr:hypothetical protein [Verrucomicrobiae bacterium]